MSVHVLESLSSAQFGPGCAILYQLSQYRKEQWCFPKDAQNEAMGV